MNRYIINKNKSIRTSLFQLEKNKEKCLIAIDQQKSLFGTLTDGDIRRALLKKASLDTKIEKFVKKKPIHIKIKSLKINNKSEIDQKIIKLLNLTKNENIDLIPIVDKKKKIIDVISISDFKKNITKKKKDILFNIPVLIMAGGRGSRLKQFSNYFPKPLFPVGEKTAIEHIINNFSNYGVNKFFISVLYKKNLIKSYLKENNYKNIKYLDEKIPLGTAGCISLLNRKIKNDFFVINCDSILSINYEKLYDFHKKNNFQITIVAASKSFKISYGVCEINKKNGELIKIKEKPAFNYLVSGGMYLMKASVIKKIPRDKPLDMDVLIKKIKKNKGKVGVFPISEDDWTDIGNIEEINSSFKLNEN